MNNIVSIISFRTKITKKLEGRKKNRCDSVRNTPRKNRLHVRTRHSPSVPTKEFVRKSEVHDFVSITGT